MFQPSRRLAVTLKRIVSYWRTLWIFRPKWSCLVTLKALGKKVFGGFAICSFAISRNRPRLHPRSPGARRVTWSKVRTEVLKISGGTTVQNFVSLANGLQGRVHFYIKKLLITYLSPLLCNSSPLALLFSSVLHFQTSPNHLFVWSQKQLKITIFLDWHHQAHIQNF